MHKNTMRLLGSALVVATMASAAMASEPSAKSESVAQSERNFRSARASYVEGRHSVDVGNSLEDQNPFGTVVPWSINGMKADDPRQSVNGN
jgi:hypothetical protein